MKNHSLLAFIKLERLWIEAVADSADGLAHVDAIEVALVTLWKQLTYADRMSISEHRVRTADMAYRTTLTLWHHRDPLELTATDLAAQIAEGSTFVERRVTESFSSKVTLALLEQWKPEAKK